MINGKNIDHGKDIDYNDDKVGAGFQLIEVVTTDQDLKIEIWDVDFQHALEGHPEVTIERIRNALKNPVQVVQSKRVAESVCSIVLRLRTIQNLEEFIFAWLWVFLEQVKVKWKQHTKQTI
jgi:hypothetical protein